MERNADGWGKRLPIPIPTRNASLTSSCPPGPAGRVSGTGGETLLLCCEAWLAGGRRPAAAASASRAGRALAASSAALLRPIACVLCNRTAPRVGRIVLVVVVDRIDMGCLGAGLGAAGGWPLCLCARLLGINARGASACRLQSVESL